MKEWLFKVVACPKCKGTLIPCKGALRCPRCQVEYPIEEGIPALLDPTLSTALREDRAPVKAFYLKERYDWTRDPRGLEYAYHRYRKWETLRQIVRNLKPSDLVLDVGCGTGLITREIPRQCQGVVALDLNRWALSRMDGQPHVAKVQGDAEALPIQDKSIDLVIATEVIEHLEEPEKAAGELFRVCKRGGRAVGSVPSTSAVWKFRRQLSLTCSGNEPFHNSFARSEIIELWQGAGFRVTVAGACLGLNWLWSLEKP